MERDMDELSSAAQLQMVPNFRQVIIAPQDQIHINK